MSDLTSHRVEYLHPFANLYDHDRVILYRCVRLKAYCDVDNWKTPQTKYL